MTYLARLVQYVLVFCGIMVVLALLILAITSLIVVIPGMFLFSIISMREDEQKERRSRRLKKIQSEEGGLSQPA